MAEIVSEEYELPEMEEPTGNVMQQVQQYVAHMNKLQQFMVRKEAEFKAAEKRYLEFSQKTLPEVFRLNGLTAIADDHGHIYTVETVTKCSINKNDADRANVAKWLREHGAGSLIKGELNVPVSQKQRLVDSGVIFEEAETMNTNAVKSFILGALGQKESPATITIDDLPKGLNFFQFDQVVIH